MKPPIRSGVLAPALTLPSARVVPYRTSGARSARSVCQTTSIRSGPGIWS